jgi:hypothetical protein
VPLYHEHREIEISFFELACVDVRRLSEENCKVNKTGDMGFIDNSLFLVCSLMAKAAWKKMIRTNFSFFFFLIRIIKPKITAFCGGSPL